MPSAGALSRFEEQGAVHFAGAVVASLPQLTASLQHLPADRTGIRIQGVAQLRQHLAPVGAIGMVAASLLGSHAQAVRAILFDKTLDMNWALGWHQDRTICVRQRLDVDGFAPWTVKQGLLHVAPPFDILARMITLRVHLDPVPESNAPLLIAPGSHRRGRLNEAAIDSVVREHGSYACLAEAGDVWAYATPILHASNVAARPARRRVLQVDYAAIDLPNGLEWLGV